MASTLTATPSSQPFGHAPQSDQWGASDGLKDRVLHDGVLPWTEFVGSMACDVIVVGNGSTGQAESSQEGGVVKVGRILLAFAQTKPQNCGALFTSVVDCGTAPDPVLQPWGGTYVYPAEAGVEVH
jgi:hypothetical protein